VEEDGAQTTYSYDDNDRLIEANYPRDKIEKIRETYLTPPNSQQGPGQDNGLHNGWDNGNGNSGADNGKGNGNSNGNKHTQSNNFSLFSMDTVKSASLENGFYHIFGHGNSGGGNNGGGNGGGNSGSGGNNNGGSNSNNGGGNANSGNSGGNGGLNGNTGGNGNGAGNENGNGNGNNGNHGDGNNGNHGDGNKGNINPHGNNGRGKAFGKDKAKQNKNKFVKTIMEEDLPAYMVKPQSKVQYTYDEAGNRLTMTDDDGTINYYYDDDNRLVSEGGNELKYNEAGDLIQKTDENGTSSYSYDAADRLSQVTVPDGTSVNYSYDAYGRKISQEENYWQYDGKTKHLRDQTTDYLYRGETLLKEYTGEGSPLAEYYTANGKVIARNMFGFHDRKTWGNADNIRTRGGLMYYHYDALGNVTDLTDRLGENVVKYRWDAFGGMFAGVLAPYSRMGITGKEYDPKTGLAFFGSRWYNPMVGQFIMPDTFMGQLNKPQSLNTYAYAWNNPVNRTDPTGHWVDNSDGTYTAESGDTLWGLAQETTGDGSNWTDLGYTGTPENLQIGETIGTSSGDTSSGDTTSGGTSSGGTTSGGASSGSTTSGGTSSNGGGSSDSGYSGGDDYTPPPPPPEGGSILLPDVQNVSSDLTHQGTGNLIASTDPYFGLDQESTREKIDKLLEASKMHKAVQQEVALRYGPFIIEYPIKGGGKNGGYGSIDVYDPFTSEAWEVKPDNAYYTRGEGSKQLERYIKAGNGTIVPGHILESFSFTYNSDMTVSVRSGSSPFKYESGMIYYSASSNQKQPSTEPQTSILGESAGALAGAGAAYWIISELSRLFPPRNLIPVP